MTLDNEAVELRFLEAVESRLKEMLTQHDDVLPHSTQTLSAVARHLCLTGQAKRVRPLLTYYFGLALGVDTQKLVDAAAASELLHSASLLHDDVVDDATVRRGIMSANAKWSNSVAVLSGNYLLSIAFELLRDYSIELTQDGVRVIGEMTRAAIAEIDIRTKVTTDSEIWRKIALGKTGALFGMCGLAAARLSNDVEAISRVIRCGSHIGVIFQMTDDVLDIIDDAGLKDRYSDIKNKEPSFPLILASQDHGFQMALAEAWSHDIVTPQEAISLGKLAIECGAIDKTMKIMEKEVECAIDCLGPLASTEGGKKIVYWLKRLSDCSARA
jgi:octaprenyl-diphosphate synthase